MTIVKTHIDHKIDDKEFKEQVSKTADLIKYAGKEYFDKLKQLNSEYHIPNKREISEKELLECQIDQLHKERLPTAHLRNR